MSEQLGNFTWGSSPAIPVSFYYDYRRSGTDMQYRISVVIGAVYEGQSHFGYGIGLSVNCGGAKDSHGLKYASTEKWYEDITYTTDWLTVRNKTSGNTSLTITLVTDAPRGNSSYSYSLYVAPAEATITGASNITAGNACSVTWKPNNSEDYFKLKLSLGGWSTTVTVGSTGSKTSYTYTGYTIPLATAASNMPSSATGTATATLYTYADSAYKTFLGSSSKTFTITLPSSVKPSISGVSISEATGGLPSFNGYIQGKSKLDVSISASAGSGSSISKYETTVFGVKYVGASFTSGVLANSGDSVAVTVTVTDARGRSANRTETIKVLPYAPPSLETISFERGAYSGGTWTADLSGSDIKLSCTLGLSIAENRADVTIYVGETVVKTLQDISSGSIVEYLASFGTDATKNVSISAEDYVGGSVLKTVTISSVNVPFNINPDLPGAAFGKVAEKENTMECAFDAEFTGGVKIGGVSVPDMIYPVGSIYLSVSSANPAALFGGTWERIKDRFLLAAGYTYSAGSTGGEASKSLTTGNLPAHSHRIDDPSSNYELKFNGTDGTSRSFKTGAGSGTAYSGALTTQTTGSGTAFSIMPPYLAVYVWRRTG